MPVLPSCADNSRGVVNDLVARAVNRRVLQEHSHKQRQTLCWISRSQVRLCDEDRMSQARTSVAPLDARYSSVRSQMSWVDNTVLCEWLADSKVSLTTWLVSTHPFSRLQHPSHFLELVASQLALVEIISFVAFQRKRVRTPC
jgi:hypothetical protein